MSFLSLRLRRACALVALLLVALAHAALGIAHAEAQEGPSDAEALIARGVELRRRGDDEGALALFRQAYALDPGPRALAQMALAEQALGQFVDAEAHLVAALATTGDAWIESRRAALTDALSALEARLGTIELRGGVSGAEVRLDGVVAARLPLTAPLRAPPGSYRLEVTAEGRYPFVRTVIVVAEGTTRVQVDMAAAPTTGAVSGTPIVVSPSSPSPQLYLARALGIAATATGGALLVSSAASFGVRERAAADWNDDACLAGGRSRGENCEGFRLRAERAQRAAAATLAVGGAFAITGVVLVLTDAKEDEDALACAPSLGDGVGGACTWRF